MLPFGPETMLQRVVRLLGTVVSPIVVVAAETQELPALPPGTILTRDERDASGPLEGIRAGLAALPEGVDAAYITSCDVPLLVPAFVRRMIELADGYDIAITENDGFAHPLSAIYRRAALPHAHRVAGGRPVACLEPVPAASYAPRASVRHDKRGPGAGNAQESQYEG